MQKLKLVLWLTPEKRLALSRYYDNTHTTDEERKAENFSKWFERRFLKDVFL